MSITVEDEGEVAIVRMGFAKANAMSTEFFDALERGLESAESARAIVLTGAASVFSVGLDLRHVARCDGAALLALIERFSGFMRRLFLWPRPVVAALGGHAVAGGLVLALACDRRIVADVDAKLGLTGLSLGITYPSIVLAMARFALPPPRLNEVVLEGRLYAPREALAAGLVERVVAPERLLDEALAIARSLAAGEAEAYGRVKAAIKEPEASWAEAHRRASHEAFVASVTSEVSRARIAAALARITG